MNYEIAISMCHTDIYRADGTWDIDRSSSIQCYGETICGQYFDAWYQIGANVTVTDDQGDSHRVSREHASMYYIVSNSR